MSLCWKQISLTEKITKQNSLQKIKQNSIKLLFSYGILISMWSGPKQRILQTMINLVQINHLNVPSNLSRETLTH